MKKQGNRQTTGLEGRSITGHGIAGYDQPWHDAGGRLRLVVLAVLVALVALVTANGAGSRAATALGRSRCGGAAS